MIKALVSIDADLASSIALRCTCQLANLVDVEIQTIHVHEPETAGPGGLEMGAGWARRAYEKVLIEEGKKGISQLLIAESGFCPVLKEPLIFSGDRGKQIIGEIQKGGYHLYVEGMSGQMTSKTLSKLLRSHLFQNIPAPVLLVQNLLPLKRVFLLVEQEKDFSSLFGTFTALFKGADLEVDLLLLQQGDHAESLVASARQVAQNNGWNLNRIEARAGKLDSFAQEDLKESSMVVTLAERHVKGKGFSEAMMEFLGGLSSPILFCWK